MTYSINELLDSGKAIPFKQFFEELNGMAAAFANDDDTENDECDEEEGI